MQEVSKLAKTTTTKSVQMELEVTYYQAVLKRVDIAKINPITVEDLALVKKMSGFTKVGSSGGVEVNAVQVPSGTSGSLFGF